MAKRVTSYSSRFLPNGKKDVNGNDSFNLLPWMLESIYV
jgi:hypothetical protein